MPCILKYKYLRAKFANQRLKLNLWGFNLLLGANAIFFSFSTSANAAKSITLVYDKTQTSTSIIELQRFASRGEMTENLQKFFQNTPPNSESVRHLLTARIPVNRAWVERNFSNSTERFILIQLDKLIGIHFRQENFESLRSALVAAYGDDDRLSMLELIEEYPEPEIRVDLRNLEKVYNDVSDLITRMQPLLAVSEELLPELVCDRENLAELKTELNTDLYSILLPQLMASVEYSSFGLLAHKTPSDSNDLARRSTRFAIAASKQIVLTFGPFRGSISIRELESFAETGQLSSALSFYLKQAKVKPEDFREVLTQEVNASVKLLDRTLNSLLGEYLLFQVGQVIHTRSGRANIQALRSALVLSAIGDNRISLLEFLQKYPNQQVYVNGMRLARVSRFAKRGLAGVEDRLLAVQASVADRVCDRDD